MRIPRAAANVTVEAVGRPVALTNLDKPFWPELGVTKGDLLQYYLDVAPVLLPHVRDRPMVMKRYPNGAAGDFFFMKRAPRPRPAWIEVCSVAHHGDTIDYPLIQDVAALLWVVNLGCIDLNPFYARCDDVDRPDYVCFDLDPGSARFEQVVEAALRVRDALLGLGMAPLLKTRLQPERLGPDAGLHLLGQADRGRQRVDAHHLARARARRGHRRLPHRQRAGAGAPPRRSVGAAAGRRRPLRPGHAHGAARAASFADSTVSNSAHSSSWCARASARPHSMSWRANSPSNRR